MTGGNVRNIRTSPFSIGGGDPLCNWESDRGFQWEGRGEERKGNWGRGEKLIDPKQLQ